MFQFRRCPPRPLWIQGRVTSLLRPGFPIRIPTDQCSLAAPRGVSPLAASFIGTLPQGIRHVPFSASYQDLRAATLSAARAIPGPGIAGPRSASPLLPICSFQGTTGRKDLCLFSLRRRSQQRQRNTVRSPGRATAPPPPLVEVSGLEPLACCLQSNRSPS